MKTFSGNLDFERTMLKSKIIPNKKRATRIVVTGSQSGSLFNISLEMFI